MKKVSPIMKRHRIFSIILGILLLITLGFILYSIDVNYLSGVSFRELFRLRKNLAVAGAILFALAGVLFCIRVFLKYSTIKGFENFAGNLNIKVSKGFKEDFLEGDLIKALRSLFIVMGKIFQNIHVIVGFLGAIVISLHVYIAFHMGAKLTIGYIAGYITIAILLLLMITSARRLFNKSIKSHKWLGVWLIIFMIIHLLLIKP